MARNYKANVLGTNKVITAVKTTFGAQFNLIVMSEGSTVKDSAGNVHEVTFDPIMKAIAKAMKSRKKADQEIKDATYKWLKNCTKVGKTGKYSAFRILQAMYNEENQKQYQEEFLAEN